MVYDFVVDQKDVSETKKTKEEVESDHQEEAKKKNEKEEPATKMIAY